MLKSTIAGFVYPVSRRAGESIDCVVSVRNDGNEEGWFLVNAALWTGSEAIYYYSEWDQIMPGVTKQFPVSLLMPQGDATIMAWAGWWDYAAQATVWDAQTDWVTVKSADAPVLGPPKAVIVNYKAPGSARNGAPVLITATIRNDGQTWGYCLAAVAYTDAGSQRWIWGPWTGLYPGDSAPFTLEFPMPATATTLVVYAQHYDFDLGMGINDASTSVLTVALDASEWLNLQLPEAIASALDTGWANITAGEWMNALGIKIPPFSFEPGRWALKGLNWIIDGVNWTLNKLKEVGDKAAEALRNAGTALTKINDWLSSASSWWNSRISGWWSSTMGWVDDNIISKVRPVWDYAYQLARDITGVQVNVDGLGSTTKSWQSWLLGSLASISPIDVLITGYNKLENFFSVYLSQIDDFFKSPAGWIFDRIDDWLNERVE